MHTKTKERIQRVIWVSLWNPTLTDAEIARQLGIRRQVISNDRRRHAEFWASETCVLEFILILRVRRLLDDHIKEYQEQLSELHSRRAANKAVFAAYQADLEASRDSVSPNFGAILRKKSIELEGWLDVAFARQEKVLSLRLSEALAKRWGLADVSPNLYGDLPDVAPNPPGEVGVVCENV